MRRALLLCSILSAIWANENAADAITTLDLSLAPAARFASHKPQFSVAKETIVFTEGDQKQVDFWVIRDAGLVVGVVHPGMNQLDMATFRPDQTQAKPAFQSFYSWGRLLGTRITTAAWYPDQSTSGTTELSWSAGGTTLTLNTVQRWSTAPNGESRFAMTLSVDPIHGYHWDIVTDMTVAEPLKNKEGKAIVPVFLNWQVKVVEMGQYQDRKRWPLAWVCDRKVFLNSDDKLVGMYMNPLAIDRSPLKRTTVREGGFVAKLPDADGWGVALVHLEKQPFTTNNATCNMWADSHNMLKFPDQPNADGRFSVRGRWRFLALPPEEVTDIVARTTMNDMGRKEFPARIGVAKP